MIGTGTPHVFFDNLHFVLNFMALNSLLLHHKQAL